MLCVYCAIIVFFCYWCTICVPSVLWYCWFGHLTCKNRLPYNLYCVGGDVKHCFLTRWKNYDASTNQSNNFDVSRKHFKPSTPGSTGWCILQLDAAFCAIFYNVTCYKLVYFFTFQSAVFIRNTNVDSLRWHPILLSVNNDADVVNEIITTNKNRY